MTLLFNPLREKAEQLNTVAQPYQHIYDQIADQITFTDLTPCPLCHDDQVVEYIQPHNNPEHGEYSVAISCRQCRIQTQPQYWFISEPTSATRALNAAIENWQQLTPPLPAGEAQGEGKQADAEAADKPDPPKPMPPTTETIPAYRPKPTFTRFFQRLANQIKAEQTAASDSGADKAERRAKFNPAAHAITFEQMAKLDRTGEETEVTVEYGDNGESINGVIIPHEQWQAIKQDAARYQYILATAYHFDSSPTTKQLTLKLSIHQQVAVDPGDRISAYISKLLDANIDASIKQQAANP